MIYSLQMMTKIYHNGGINIKSRRFNTYQAEALLVRKRNQLVGLNRQV